MKKILLIAIIIMVNIITIKSMQELPMEDKLLVASQLLEQKTQEGIINELNGLKLVNVEFYNLIANEPYFLPFFELNKTKSPIEALRLIYHNPQLLGYPDSTLKCII